MRITGSEIFPVTVPNFAYCKSDLPQSNEAQGLTEIEVHPQIENTPLPEESEELYRYTKFGIITIVYSCGYRRFVLEIDETPELRVDENHHMPFAPQNGMTVIKARGDTTAAMQAYTSNLWSNAQSSALSQASR